MAAANQIERFNSIVDKAISISGEEKAFSVLPSVDQIKTVGKTVVADMGLVVFTKDTIAIGRRQSDRHSIVIPSENVAVYTIEDEDLMTRELEHHYGNDHRVLGILKKCVTMRPLLNPEQTKLNKWLERPFITEFPGKIIKRLESDEVDQFARFRARVDDFERQFVELDIQTRQAGFIQRDGTVPFNPIFADVSKHLPFGYPESDEDLRIGLVRR